jgi:signal transduction histidine kinase
VASVHGRRRLGPQDDAGPSRPPYAGEVTAKNSREEVLGWPLWVPAVFGLLALIPGVVVIVQRQVVGRGPLVPVLFATLVAAPFVVNAVSTFVQRSPLDETRKRTEQRLLHRLDKWLFPIPVLAGMGLLAANTTELEFAPFILVLLCAMMASGSGDEPWFGVVVTVASCALMVSFEVFGSHDDAFVWVIGISFGWFGGFSISLLAEQTLALKLANAELAEKSAAEERQRIAREVHDVIAHSLSVTMLHVTAARMALERDRTEDALDALREAEKQGRSSLSEVRRTVGLLGPDESGTAPPMPGVADLPRLVADFRAAGLDATLAADAKLDDIPAAAGLNLYRIVQESLTNAAKHAPGAPVNVELRMDGGEIRLCVHNGTVNGVARNATGGGMGLKSMAERASLLGGEFATDDSDGWTVTVTAPRPVA